MKPEEFVALADEATRIGFAGVMSGPLVRSSYRAGRLHQQALEARAAGRQRHHRHRRRQRLTAPRARAVRRLTSPFVGRRAAGHTLGADIPGTRSTHP